MSKHNKEDIRKMTFGKFDNEENSNETKYQDEKRQTDSGSKQEQLSSMMSVKI